MIYKHRVQYYETDQMGIAHHSNHVRWMEEARSALLDEIGHPYLALEKQGIRIPVLWMQIEYKHPAKFYDVVEIELRLYGFKMAKFSVEYVAYSQERDVLFTARTGHGLVGEDFRPLRIKKTHPDLYEALSRVVMEEREE